MANLKDIRSRIATVKKTRQITSAMKLVAGAKLKRATDRALAARPYREQLEAVLRRVAAVAGEQIDEELLKPREDVKNVLVIVLTSDRGLCGPFNNGLLRQLSRWYADREADGLHVVTRVYGRKGDTVLKRAGTEIDKAVTDYERIPKMDLVKPLTSHMVAGFVDREFDEVYVVYNRFVSALSQVPTFERILPLVVELDGERGPG